MSRWIPIMLFVAAGCHGQDKAEATQRAEAEKQAEIDARAKQIAEKVVSEVEEQQRVAESLKKIEEMRVAQAKLLAEPAEFFEASGIKLSTRGEDERALRSVREVSLTNKSRYGVTQVHARLELLQDGAVVASVPLTLRGAIPAGATRRFSVEDETLQAASVQGASNENRVIVTSVALDEVQPATP
jgi:hypothetical protein